MAGSFFKELFDLSFSSFITVKIIKFLYVIAIITSLFFGFLILIGGLSAMKQSPKFGIFLLVFSPVFTFLSIIYSRVILEFILVMFKIEENTKNLKKE